MTKALILSVGFFVLIAMALANEWSLAGIAYRALGLTVAGSVVGGILDASFRMVLREFYDDLAAGMMDGNRKDVAEV